LSTEEFLRQARYALYLRNCMVRDQVRHVHAMGACELLAAWLLRRLTGVTISATLEEKPAIHDDVLLVMAKDCAGVAGDRLHAKLRAGAEGSGVVSPKTWKSADVDCFASLRQWSM